MSVNSVSSLPKTPLDYIAQGYWQDFLAAQPIAGGIAYEAHLQHCQLDESLISLQRVDTLLTQIRRELSKSAHLHEGVVLADERYRNLLLFLAFYAGRVLAKQWQSVPQWYGVFEIEKRYPELALTTADFYQQMAVVYTNTQPDQAHLFFALEPIGLRLFGSIDRQFIALQGGQVASGLYQAVSARLPDSLSDSVTKLNHAPHKPLAHSLPKVAAVAPAVVETVLIKPTVAPTPKPERLPVSTAAAPIVENATIEKRSITVKPVAPTPDIFSQLLLELDEIEVPQTAGQADYQQACKVLNQFERHIAKQDKPRSHVQFSTQHQNARLQALGLLKQSAGVGNTAAMSRLAMYELLNEGLENDKTAALAAGVNWVKQAADSNDSRAQRLLSKLYYQGIGVTQDISQGQHWLTQAAHNGHAEAAQLSAQWQQAQDLMSTQKQEQQSIKRYQLLIAAIIVASLLLIILV